MPISPTLRQIEAFCAVARTRSFGRAAEALGMSQSALSQSVAQMERLLGVPLFARTRRSVAILPAAERFLPRARALLEGLEAAVADLRNESDPREGRVEIACLSTVSVRILPGAVAAFRARFPRAAVRVRDDDPDGIVERVKSGGADFAVSALFERDPAVEFRPLLEDDLRFVCRPDHPLAGRREMRWEELPGHELVATAAGTGIRALIDRHLPDVRPFRRAAYEVARIPSILDVVEQSGAVSVIPALALLGLEEGRFHHAPIGPPHIRRRIGVITARDRAPTAAARAFVDMLGPHLAAARGPGIRPARARIRPAAPGAPPPR